MSKTPTEIINAIGALLMENSTKVGYDPRITLQDIYTVIQAYKPTALDPKKNKLIPGMIDDALVKIEDSDDFELELELEYDEHDLMTDAQHQLVEVALNKYLSILDRGGDKVQVKKDTLNVLSDLLKRFYLTDAEKYFIIDIEGGEPIIELREDLCVHDREFATTFY